MALPRGFLPIHELWLEAHPLADELRERVFYAGAHPGDCPDYYTRAYRLVVFELIQRGLLTEEGLEECRVAGILESDTPDTERWQGLSTIEQRKPFEEQKNREMRAVLDAIADQHSPSKPLSIEDET